MRDGRCGDFRAAEHARNFFHPRGIVQRHDICARSSLFHALRNRIVRVPEDCYLREMRNTNYLSRTRHFSKFSTNRFRRGAADAAVHLVKHIGRRQPRRIGERALDCKEKAREFAPRSGARQRTKLLAHIGRNEELDVVGAARIP